MSNRLRHYRRFMLRSAAEAKGGKLFRRGRGRAVMDDPSRLSTALHKARGTKQALKAKPKRGLDAKRPNLAGGSGAVAPETKKKGISEILKSAIRRRMAQ